MTTNHKRRPAVARVWIPAAGTVAAVALAVAGCGGASGGQGGSAYGGGGSQPAPAASAQANAASGGSHGALVRLADSNLGRILVNSQGRTLYLFQADKGSTSTCSGACASAWPPVITNGPPIAGAGISGAKLSTTKRSDGTSEITYNGHPLYTFVGDSSPGQATGQGSPEFGAEWDVVSAAGDRIDTGTS